LLALVGCGATEKGVEEAPGGTPEPTETSESASTEDARDAPKDEPTTLQAEPRAPTPPPTNLPPAGVVVVVDGATLPLPKLDASHYVKDWGRIAIDAKRPDVEGVYLTFPSTPGKYTCAERNAYVGYWKYDQGYEAPGAPGASCTITVTEVGAVAGKLQGSYEAVVKSGSRIPATATIKGTFHVTRTADR